MNDVLQRVSGESQPVPLWRTASTEDVDTAKEKEIPLLYSFRLNLKVIAACTRLLYLTHVSVEFLSHNDVSWVPFCCILTISPNFVSFSPCHCWIDFSHSNQQLSEIWFFGTRDTLLEAFFSSCFSLSGNPSDSNNSFVYRGETGYWWSVIRGVQLSAIVWPPSWSAEEE